MENLMRVKWAHKSNILMVLEKYLKKYSSFDYVKAAKGKHPLACLMDIAKKDFTVIDEIFGETDVKRKFDQNEYPIRVEIEELIATIESKYKITEFNRMYIQY